jgi:hypothetical protein
MWASARLFEIIERSTRCTGGIMNLPPLPEAEGKQWADEADDWARAYTECQMRSYGALCRKMALEEAAGICDDISTKHNDTYKHKPGPNAYDPHYQGLSMGADECSEAIRELIK